MTRPITILGSFVADVAFRTPAMPRWGETLLGSVFRLGPGGKGSNQAVAAARLGGTVRFVSKLGRDTFGDMARELYRDEGVETSCLFATDESTGAAAIIIDEKSGENGIIIVPGACFHLTDEELAQASPLIAASTAFLAQLEQDISVVQRGLEYAHKAGVATILNPAPAAKLPDAIYPLCDYLTPNESEATALTGIPVGNLAEASQAADALLARGVRNVVVTLGANGALLKNHQTMKHIPAVDAGPVVETTGAGDAFNGGFAVGLAEGMSAEDAVAFGCAAAGISVTRSGTAPSMPRRAEVDDLLARRT
ncbi:ribokinase [Alloacidobacterium sp.]|uniref:ribokinase n=1 Tax=Alloacidobacterium sp. TaxID=2951999 RepID=UPI002D30AB93|nr:ribokinase [Alloacidobacterium sp.]HYK37686.1 ribokinase [Alloacidobacterium sp.]